MSFWANVTGGAPQPPAAPVYPQVYPQAYPPQQPAPGYQAPGYPQIPQAYTQQPLEDPAVTASKAKAQSSRSNMTCPECGSGNIFKPNGIPNAMEQCYHCGWNPRFTQSTAGAGMPSTAETGPARPARQISTANNFNPQTIVATVGA